MSKLAFYKDDLDRKNNHLFVPKMFIRYAPGLERFKKKDHGCTS